MSTPLSRRCVANEWSNLWTDTVTDLVDARGGGRGFHGFLDERLADVMAAHDAGSRIGR